MRSSTNLRNRPVHLALTSAFFVLALTTATAALQGHVLALDGHGDYMEIPDTPELHAAEDLTLTTWFRVDDPHATWQTLLWKGNLTEAPGHSNREFGLFYNSRGYIHLSSTPVSRVQTGHLTLDTPADVIGAGQWYHVAAVINSSANSMTIYHNGNPVAIRTFDTSGIRDTSGPLRLGAPNHGSEFRGLIDEARIWNRALSGNEIRRNMNRAVAQPQPGLIAYYRFEGLDAQGSVPDLSGNGHHGRLVGDAHLKTIGVLMPPVSFVDSAPAASPDSSSVAAVTAPDISGAPPQAQAPHDSTPATDTGDATDLMIQALGHEDRIVRHKTANSLHKLTGPALVPVLSFALQSEDTHVRHQAARVLENLDPDNLQLASSATERDIMLVHGQTVIALTEAAIDAAQKQVGARQPPPAPQPGWHSQRYLEWERKWSAETPDYWDLDSEGLVLRYNRVEGLYTGWMLPREYRKKSGTVHYGDVGFGFGNEDWQYRAGGELYSFYGPPKENSHLMTIGLDVHNLVDTQDGWLISLEENSIDAVLFKRDYRDYYRRFGWSAYNGHNIGGILQVTGRYARDEFESLDNAVGWGIMGNRFARDNFRPNPDVSEGVISSARVDVQLDTRDGRHHYRQGWFVNGLFERAGGPLQGDYEFKRYLLDLRRYQPVDRGTHLDLRLRTGTAKGDLPLQYLFDVGGFSSLRGYDFKQFSGDRMVLINLEYWVDAETYWTADLPIEDLGLGLFFDAGSAWFASDRSDPFKGADEPALKRSFGFGVGTSDQEFRVDIARPLDDDREGWRLLARFSRPF